MFLDTDNPEYVALTQVYRNCQPNFVCWQFTASGIDAMVRRLDGTLEPMEASEYKLGSLPRECFRRLYALLEG